MTRRRQPSVGKRECTCSTTPCRFIEIAERLPECPCACVPPIDTGPACPFKSPFPGGPPPCPVQCFLQLEGSTCDNVNCPSVNNASEGQQCVFSQSQRIDFKSLPRYACSCLPGTCPEIAKNYIRALGFDPMCACPCPKTLTPVRVTAQTQEINKVKTSKKDRKTRKAKSDHTAGSEMSPEHGESSVIKVGSAVEAAKSTETRAVARVASASKVGASDAPGIKDGLAAAVAEKSHSKQRPRPSSATDLSGPQGGHLLVDGKGFRIYDINGDKVLFNFSIRNCEFIGCKCTGKDKSCGCDEWLRITKYRNCCCPGGRNKPPKMKPIFHEGNAT